MLDESDKGRLSKRKFVALGFLVVLVVSLVIGSIVIPTDASETPRTMLVDRLMLVAVDTDGDGLHDLEIAVTEILKVAVFDDGTQGIWIKGDVNTLDPLLR